MRAWQTRDFNTNLLIVVIPPSLQFCVVKQRGKPTNRSSLLANAAGSVRIRGAALGDTPHFRFDRFQLCIKSIR